MMNISLVELPELWRVRHDAELGPLWRVAPEVFPLEPARPNKFTREWQLLSYELNPGMTKNAWRSVYRYDRAFTNETGFDNPAQPYADFVNGADLTAPVPEFDKVRLCGGASVRGHLDGFGNLVVYTLSSVPTIPWLFNHPWYMFDAVTVYSDGHVGHFPQGNGHPVWVPLFSSFPVTIPVENVEKLPAGSYLADPFKM